MTSSPSIINEPSRGPSGVIEAAIAETLSDIQTGLEKEGASVDVRVDEDEGRLLVDLKRHRIVCEECLLPAKLVQTMLKKALRSDANTRNLGIKVVTSGWELP